MHECSNCAQLQLGIDQLAAWLQENEAAYAEKHLRYSRIIAMQEQSKTANVISRSVTVVLEKIDELFPAPKPRTKGLLEKARIFLFGRAA